MSQLEDEETQSTCRSTGILTTGGWGSHCAIPRMKGNVDTGSHVRERMVQRAWLPLHLYVFKEPENCGSQQLGTL